MATVLHVIQKTSLVDRHYRGEAHRNRRELPEVGHEPWVWVRCQATALCELSAEVVKFLRGQSARQICACVDAGGSVPLEVDQVAAAGMVRAAEEMIEPDLVECGCRRVRRDVPTDPRTLAVGFDNHRESVPADDALDPILYLDVAGVWSLLVNWDRVDVRSARRHRERNSHALRRDLKRFEESASTFRSAAACDVADGIDPFLGFYPIAALDAVLVILVFLSVYPLSGHLGLRADETAFPPTAQTRSPRSHCNRCRSGQSG